MSEGEQRRIGLVIVNYNTGDFLRKCVLSTLKSKVPLDIVVVDNNSSDGSLSSIPTLGSGTHRLRTIKNQTNTGFSVAVNQGVLKLKNKYIMILNPDCTVFPQTFLKLHHALASNSNAGIAGALVFNPDGSEQRGCRRREPTLKRSVVTALGQGHRFEGIDMISVDLPKDPEEVDAVSGAAMMIRREFFDEIGGMDEDYFLHCEDLDVCRLMRDYGYSVLFCPAATVIHSKGGSTGPSKTTVEKHKHDGMMLYNKKHAKKKGSKTIELLIPALIKVHYYFGIGINYFKSNARNSPEDGFSTSEKSILTTLDFNKKNKPLIVITGGKSDVGDYLIRHISNSDCICILISRNTPDMSMNEKISAKNVYWVSLEYFSKSPAGNFEDIDVWINLAPVWTTKILAKLIHKYSPKKIVSLSSTSIETKSRSNAKTDLEVVEKLRAGEKWLEDYVENYDIGATVLRPTMIYGGPRNKNINFIERVIKTSRFFPLVGGGKGKRQPIHAEDVAIACILLSRKSAKSFSTYNIAGSEVLSYKEMVGRVFDKLGFKQRFLTVPEKLLTLPLSLLSKVPGLNFLTSDMIQRMNHDLIFSNDPAEKSFSFHPRKFKP